MANYELGTLQNTTITQPKHTLTSKDRTDVFQFDIDSKGFTRIELTNVNKDGPELALFFDGNGNGVLDSQDRSGWQVAFSSVAGQPEEFIRYNHQPGTYFAEVSSSGGKKSYDLNLTTSVVETPSAAVTMLTNSKLNFNFTYEGDESGNTKVSQQQMIAFEIAGKIWSQYLRDDITLNIHIDVTDDLPHNVIGGAMPGFLSQPYTQVRDALSENLTSEHDYQAAVNLDVEALDSTLIRYRPEGRDTILGVESPSISPTRANLKALESSSISSHTSELDGYILMNTLNQNSMNWHYDQYDTSGENLDSLSSNELDFLSVAIHEIGHILGFASGIDYKPVDWPNLYSLSLDSYSWFYIHQDRQGVASTLDLFRYLPNGDGGRKDISIGGNPFFSIIGGEDAYNPSMPFANGRTPDGDDWVGQQILGGLDNFQTSHWELGTDGIMVPAIAPGQRNEISEKELIAFDVLGYDRTSGFSLPDYASFYQAAKLTVAQYSPSRSNQSRLDDVLTMIENSTMYEGRGSRTRSSIRQEIENIFAQEALHSTFNEDVWDAYVKSITLNESGTSGEDVLKGGIGGDRLRGLQNADILKGYEGDDVLKGNQGGDRILGGDGNDTLIGGNGNDIVKGEAGDDILNGGAGYDILVGGEGADTFEINNAAGFNVIRDFRVGEDQLRVAEGLDITIGQHNNHTTIALANDDTNLLAILRNVDSAMISIQ